MNVVVIEDERLTAQRLILLVKKYDPSIHVLAEIASVSEAVAWFKTNGTVVVDLIFMDIHLEDGDSFQIVSRLDLKTPIIFTTAFDGYMVKAFKVNSIDYLLKPINYEELVAAMDKFKVLRLNNRVAPVDIKSIIHQLSQQNNPQFKDRFMITVGTKIRSIKTENIAYFYLEEKTVLLVTSDGTTLPVDYSLDKLIQVLDPKQFFRISRQFVVSLNAIQMVHAISAGKLKLDLSPKTKQEVAVSIDRASDFKVWLGKD
ncbi:LytR/AlgR family response regulator transcription factor [Chryseosolibacter indicus]|uniref:LytTR family DNA-binding domain-containing protein n=1 Tax=Chryseosolibacter indicus TaxID=2782351 RepID=A0ABS5W0H2_9BACT|nr:LytTR family DNA-binding domain-containing protein [Chryseosolibacter indicus]MBT1705781.1 LytTR family DNA-binding domain-containing protein [Chryseosolibacter indicus]